MITDITTILGILLALGGILTVFDQVIRHVV